jgi:hypothetical protein
MPMKNAIEAGAPSIQIAHVEGQQRGDAETQEGTVSVSPDAKQQ